MDLAYLEYRLSGGASNSDPAASLGGAMSSERLVGFTVTGVTNVTGVTVLDAIGNTGGNDGVLDFTASGTLLTWQGPGATGPGTAVNVGTDGRYTLTDDIGTSLLIEVVATSLPGTDQTDSAVTVTPVANGLFDDVSNTESLAGDIEYRCFYITNTHPTDSFLNTTVFIGQDTDGDDSLEIGLDDNGINGTAVTIVGEGTAPADVVFTAAGQADPALTVGELAAGDYLAVWQKRTVPEANTAAYPNNTSIITVEAAWL